MQAALVRLHGDPHGRLHADEHLGIAYVASSLRANGHDVSILDNTVLSDADIETAIRAASPDLLGYTVDVENIAKTIEFDQRLRDDVGSLRCWGGHHATLCAGEVLSERLCDVVVLGDGEATTCGLLEALRNRHPLDTVPGLAFRRDQDVIYTPPRPLERSLDNLPRPARDVLAEMVRSEGSPSARVLSSRGCPHNCIYCTTPAIRQLLGNRSYRWRSPEAFVDELSSLATDFGITQFYVNDDLYFLNSPASHSRVMRIASLLASSKLGISYKVELRADSFAPARDAAMLKALRQSGMVAVFLGLESGSNTMLAALRKDTTAEASIAAVRALEAAGIRVNIGRILFGPDTSWNELRDSVSTLHQIGATWQVFRHPTVKLRVFPGTELARRLRDQGRLLVERPYCEPQYVFTSDTIRAFCEALAGTYSQVWTLERGFFDRRSFGELDHDTELALEAASYGFLMNNIECGDQWSRSRFDAALGVFIRRIQGVMSQWTG